MEACTAESTVGGHVVATERQLTALKTQRANVEWALKRLAGEKSAKGADVRAQLVVVEELLSADNAHVKRFVCECATEAEKTQLMLNKRWDTSHAASGHLAKCEGLV